MVAPHPVEEVLGGHLHPVLQVPQLVALAHQLVGPSACMPERRTRRSGNQEGKQEGWGTCHCMQIVWKTYPHEEGTVGHHCLCVSQLVGLQDGDGRR